MPLQLSLLAPLAVQALPQALQLLVVFSVVHTVVPLSLHVVSRQVHEPLEQSGVGCEQVWTCQVPVLLHVSAAVLLAHAVCPGAHTPEHTPPTQVWLTHATGLPQVPLEVHVSTALPEHVVWPGAQTPEHTPPMQVWLTQLTGLPQVPLEEHVSTALPEHCVAPGEQVPLHAPLTHVELVHATVVPH